MKEIHNSKLRMPVTLNMDSLTDWLTYKTINFNSEFKAMTTD